MAASLPPFHQVVDTQGTEAFASHYSLPADSALALLPASLRTMSAPASPAASTAWRAPVLDAPLGSSSSSAVGEAPKLELSGSSGEMDLLGVCSSKDGVQYRVMSNVRSIGDAASSLYEEHRGVAFGLDAKGSDSWSDTIEYILLGSSMVQCFFFWV